MKVSELRFDLTPDPATLTGRFEKYRRNRPLHLSVAQMFSAQAARRGEALSVKLGEQKFTYRQLDAESNRYARLLAERGVCAGDYVAVMLDRGWHLVAALLGVFKAGAAYVPVNPSLPHERILSIVRQTSPRALITQARYLPEGQTLLWGTDSLCALLCADSQNWRDEPEPPCGRMNRELWDHIAETASDVIAAGGWKSAFTGQWLSPDVMREYADNAAAKILPRLHGESRVLEIGCGSGITLLRLAPEVAYYCGTDLSASALNWAGRECAAAGLSHVHLQRLAAHEIENTAGEFGAVILNSVVQSFPGLNYLRQTIARSIGRLRENGFIFLGGLWDLERRDRAASGVEGFFVSRAMIAWLCEEFPEIADVEFSELRAGSGNELAEYSFDALLSVDKTAPVRQQGDRARRKEVLDRSDLDAVSDVPFEAVASPSDTAYVIFTSGSTGQPKGVEVEMRSLVNLCCWYREFARIDEDTTVVQTIPISFDASIKNFLTPLIAGGTLVLLEEGPFDPAALLDCIRRFGVQVINPGVPSVLYPVVELAARSSYTGLASLRCVALGGESMDLSKLAPWLLSSGCQCRLTNIYGPTECTDIALCREVTRAEIATLQMPPIGTPIHNMECYVLDSAGQPEPPGVLGELCIAGTGLARGYIGDSELTGRKFVPHPFRPGERIYRTGDLARELDSGEIVFAGRMDNQVKIRGHRIEPGEIEARLRIIAGVDEAAVDVRLDSAGSAFLCAYLSGPNGGRAEWLRAELERALPDYMVPSHFFALERLPKNGHGKVDRKALQAIQASAGSRDHVAPRNELEKNLQTIWQDVLGVAEIGVNENFFQVGGHSLKTVTLSARVNMELGLELPITAIYLHQTIEEQARFLSGGGEALPQHVHRLNRSGAPPLFCFPPITGLAWSFASFARRVDEYTVYAFDFIEDPDRVARYADTIHRLSQGNATRLCGYSAGGALAFLVAREIELRGGSVAKLVLLDADRPDSPEFYSDAEIESTVAECMADPRLQGYLARDGEKESLARRVRAYGAFLSGASCAGTPNAAIELLLADPPNGNLIEKWRSASARSFRWWQAEGPHNELLDPHRLESNAKLILRMLSAEEPRGAMAV